MSVRQLNTPEELLEGEKIQSIAFGFSWDEEKARNNLEKPHSRRNVTFGHFNQEGVLTACLELPEYEMYYEGTTVPMVGVGGVASLPEYRHGGAVRSIFHTALRWMWDRGAVFSSLYPFSHAYYRKFGYELCQICTQYKLPVEALASFPCTCSVRMFQPGGDLAPFQTVYNAGLGKRNLAVRREERHWKTLLEKDPYKDRYYTYLLEKESTPLSYVVLALEDLSADPKVGVVKELGFFSPEGLFQALGLLHRLAAQYGAFLVTLPDDVPLSALLEDSYDLTPAYTEQPMARVIHVEKALERKAPPEGTWYTVKVEDQLLPENTGVFQVETREGRVVVTKLPENAPAHLSLDVQTLTQLLLGYLSLEEALYKPGVTLTGNRETLEQAFPKGCVFLTEHF